MQCQYARYCEREPLFVHILRLEWPAAEGWRGQERPGTVDIQVALCGVHENRLPSFQGTFFRSSDYNVYLHRSWWRRLLR